MNVSLRIPQIRPQTIKDGAQRRLRFCHARFGKIRFDKDKKITTIRDMIEKAR